MVKDIARTKWLIHSYFGSEYLPDWSPAAKASGDGTAGRESSIVYFGFNIVILESVMNNAGYMAPTF